MQKKANPKNHKTLKFLITLNEAIAIENWKEALDTFVASLRKEFMFDNLAIYLSEEEGNLPEVVYARALGRGRSAEADASWGETIANQVVTTGEVAQEVLIGKPVSGHDRIRQPHLLGLPLSFLKVRGALVFVRFGGPKYSPAQVSLAVLASGLVTSVFERRSLNEIASQLEIARHRAQLQDDFIATVSHDLRTPLGFIKGYTTSLLRSDTTWGKTTQDEFLNIIDEETDHLMVMIDRLLDSAQLQSGMMKMNIQSVHLDSLLSDIVVRARGRNKALEVEQDLAPAPTIQADAGRLVEVFDNLFDNASKYAPNTKITISLRQLDDHVTIMFTDRGPGIPPEHLPFLFERFYRVPGQSSNRGTGLGLFICKQIVQAHHGRISVDTAPGKGASFCVDLPLKQD